ncbi:hypothetical protein RhiirA1_485085 [Rhizophagus irregularis]|uniref:DNA replication and repair protein RecF n=1 Tax=Rhizophagus irregularis TaxID=588596 RepID=A0A2N0QIM4_9GLOM|nr:hypothetical protein RhiirA1_485085 [Rhizophagus irregularis]
MEIGQISPVYLHDLLSFQKVLKQRNHLLKMNQGKSNMNDMLFDIYTEQYIQAAVQIILGPHRDDLQFLVNDYDVQTYGSQGQQRTTALSLKLAEIELIKQETKETPILLLDDVLSELDDYRQSHLLNTIQGEVQTFVTTTSVDGIHHDTIKHAKMFHVKHGTIEQ